MFIQFPHKGIQEKSSHQETPDGATGYALNVSVDEASEGRSRGGSRPGLEKRYPSGVVGTPAFMEVVTTLDTSGQTYQILVISSGDAIAVSDAIASVDEQSITTYTETLGVVDGSLFSLGGDNFVTLGGDNWVVADVSLASVTKSTAIAYQDQVVVAPVPTTVADSGLAYIGSEFTARVFTGEDTPGNWSAVTPLDVIARVTEHSVDSTANRDWNVTAADGSNLTIAGMPDGTCKLTLLPSIKVFDPIANTVSALPLTAGYIPDRPDAMTVFRDRLVWASGRAWYMSRQGSIGDYDYSVGAEDQGAAIAATVSDAGQPGEPIVAMAAGGYDYLLFFAEDTTWVLRGDPRYDGQLYNLSRTEGCVDSHAWCYGNKGEVYFLSKQGLCVLPADMSKAPEQISNNPLPRQLRGLSRFSYNISLAYDSQDQAVVILVVPKGDGSGEHWRFDVDSGSFWKFTFANPDHQPVEAIEFSGTPNRPSRVVMACRDGIVRQMSGTDDDGTAISSEIVLGPFQASEIPMHEAIINEVTGVFDITSGTVTLGIFVDDSADEVMRRATDGSIADFTSTIGPGLTNVIRPRRRGVAFCVKVTSSNQWAFEALSVTNREAGMRRT